MPTKLTFAYRTPRVPPDKPESKAFAEFVRLNLNPLACLGDIAVSVTSGNGIMPNPLPGHAVVTIHSRQTTFEQEMDYLLDVFLRDDLVTQAAAAAQLGIPVQTISSGIKRRQIRAFANAAAPNPRREAWLVSLAEVVDLWRKR